MKTRLLFCFLLFGFYLQAQEITLSFDKTTILLGEQLQLKITAAKTNSDAIHLFALDTFPHFEVLEKSKIDTGESGNELQLTQTITLTSWDSGQWTLPSQIINGQGRNPVKINVGYTSPWDPSKPYHDIKGIVQVKPDERSTWWWYIVGAVVLIGLFLLFFPAGKKDSNAAIQLDSHAYKKAMQQLARLQSDTTTSGNSKLYYTELITIFRTYLKAGKGIQSFSKTTDDLGIQLQALKIPADQYNQLLQTLRLSDLVKFAQYQPDQSSLQNSFATIKESIVAIENNNAV